MLAAEQGAAGEERRREECKQGREPTGRCIIRHNVSCPCKEYIGPLVSPQVGYRACLSASPNSHNGTPAYARIIGKRTGTPLGQHFGSVLCGLGDLVAS
ncbi:hypothetical protein NDU88_010001 [Pleurodeles waltl]|uniref:Uncharacterized protein n=1 Tax=Pleurodeles waltl TaxID=8319 RepID=A0AAV7QWR7_PLEWA|nr:hypothetical protein NDU88_010001 [Pleurodeles waltl]